MTNLDTKDSLPTLGAGVFASGADRGSLAQLDDDCEHPFVRRGMGFKEAGDRLVEAIVSRRARPFLIAPAICFLYRHHLELMLKALIRVYRVLAGSTPAYPEVHNLLELWNELSRLLCQSSGSPMVSGSAEAEACLLALERLDPNGELSRYGVTKKGKATIPRNTRLNLRTMRDLIERTSFFLDSHYSRAHVLLEARREARRNSDYGP